MARSADCKFHLFLCPFLQIAQHENAAQTVGAIKKKILNNNKNNNKLRHFRVPRFFHVIICLFSQLEDGGNTELWDVSATDQHIA